ncbi:hypothetical protein ADIS_4826 [Lunatimonas lonarensis]|uniref:Uncharacterized protein n=1 Tax=Lunatimonas lonarensis TaxID=1232681 RepID=R7ZKU6_9BACT|nr:hypothetical protein [Lunatimonas lonarensis]EON74715.1 hypothetical protein ADIS_4826 [Lunatimonas lonarensis]
MKALNQSIKSQILFLLTIIATTPLFSQEGEKGRGSVQFFFKDGKSLISAPFLPLYNQLGEVEALADSVGVVTLPVGRHFQVKSLFYSDTVFQVVENRLTKIILEYEDVALQTFEIKFFKDPKDHIKQLSKQISSEYISSPHLGTFSGYFIVSQKGQILDFYEADGLSLLSGNSKWKPWDFASNNSSGDAYNHLVPMEVRRSFHWNLAGDTIASGFNSQVSRDQDYLISPFYGREIFRALELSGPLDEKSMKYYDFKYGIDNGMDVIYFTVKDQFKADDKVPLFLVGEGIVYLTSSGEMVERLIFNFSSYRYLNFPLKRGGRNREISGVLSVVYDRQNATILPREIGLEAKFFGERNLFRPRPFELGNESSIIEKMYLKNYEPVNKEDLENLRRGMSRIGVESMVPYDANYWAKNGSSLEEEYPRFKSDLSSKVTIERQFVANSGKRFYSLSDEEFNQLYNLYPEANTESEVLEKENEIIKNVVNQLRGIWVEIRSSE